jgi:hypothetical protein
MFIPGNAPMSAGSTVNERFSEEGDWLARQFFSPADLRLSPEEYAARHAHQIGLFSLHRHPYRDPALGAWVRRVGEILDSEEELNRCQRRFLSTAELADVQQEEPEDL